MLDILRRYASGWVAQLLIAILVVSFAVWGVSDIFTGFGQNAIARVGNTEVPVREFQRRYDLASQNIARQLGQAMTPEMLRQSGVPQQVIGQLVNEATLTDAAARLGLGVSPATLQRLITQDPSLAGPTGRYDRLAASQFIAAQRMTEDEFVESRGAAYIRNQLVQALGGGIKVPDAYLRAAHEYRAQERDVSYVVVAGPDSSAIPAPSDTDLAAYYDAHRAEWRAPEYRALRYFVLSPAQIADPAEISDEEARERYDRQASRFTIPEFRGVEQIVFPDRAAAEAAQASLGTGKTFEDLIAERNLTQADVDLGMVTRDQILDPAVADAAFSMTEAGLGPVVDGRFGAILVRVKTIEPAVVTSFEDAKAGLKMDMALERAGTQIIDLRDAIEDARAGGDTLAEAAARYDLQLVEVPAVDIGGKDPQGNPVDILDAVVADAFQSDVGLENNPVEPDRTTIAWYEVTGITPPRDLPLGEVRDRVTSDWAVAEQQKALDAEAAVIKQRLDAGEMIGDVAQALSLNVRTTENLTRFTPPNDELTAPAILAAFEGPEGHTAVAAGSVPNAKIVLRVDTIETPAYFSGTPDSAPTEEQLRGQIANDLLALYLTEVFSKSDYVENQAVIQAALDPYQ